jgi:hypothetical protein
MNRTTVLILAIVLLLAHVLAMHHDATGAYAMPSDLAHVDFRIARNWVHGFGTSWTSGSTAAAVAEEGGTSFLWIAIAALAEFFSYSPLRVTAWIGILAALGTLAFIARLSRDRLIGVTATVLLVVSGPFATSATDGTATTLFTLLLALAFLASERRRSWALGIALGLLVLTSSIGVVYAVMFLVIALLGRGNTPGLRLWPAFLPAAAAFAFLAIVRVTYDAPLLTPTLRALFSTQQVVLGLWSLEAWMRGTIAPLLILLPLAQLVMGRLSGTGRRALLLALMGTALIVLQGASEAAMHTAFVPVLPLYFIAVQEAFIGGLERKPEQEWAVWSVLGLACMASVFASKTPGDLGPLKIRPALEWMGRENPTRRAAYGHDWAGRYAVIEELEVNQRLRGIGHFFRDQVAPNSRILTPWPGAIGYLSRLQIIDLLERAYVNPAWSTTHHSTNSWMGAHRVDVVAAIERGPEYIVPLVGSLTEPPTQAELIAYWLGLFDEVGPTPARQAELAQVLEPYELVAISPPVYESELALIKETPSYLLRRRSLKLSPMLSSESTDGAYVVRVSHPGHHQLAELEVRADLNGEVHYLRPTGGFVAGTPAGARTELLLFPTGDRQIKLIEFKLPKSLAEATVTARLVNPLSDATEPFSGVGQSIELKP